MLPNKASIYNYGGILQDYKPVSDPTYSIAADLHNQMASDVANMTNTAGRSFLSFKYIAGEEYPFELIHQGYVWSGTMYYPTMQRLSSGKYKVIFPTAIIDIFEREIPIYIKAAFSNLSIDDEDDGLFVRNVKIISPNEVVILITDGTNFVDVKEVDRINLFVI